MSIAPLTKRVVVPADPDRAFELFTAEMGAWWPLATHSVGQSKATDVKLEGAVGGRIIEYGEDGPVGYWGTISDWDPPKSLSFTWHPGSDPTQAGHITVSFKPVDDGTEVELTHTGWDRHPGGAEARAAYDTGWDYTLNLYTAEVASSRQ
ncbi:SRPBCC family protein [Kribbella catacumbae]|uniref:SRPBCC family protein n=1 Tax=Kribbella catacumbae TaxID=460086 RepID=UPI00037336DB|nr:SRPBCC family protein [Kribbella catacumbae]